MTVQVGENFSIEQQSNLRKAGTFNYPGNPEGIVEAYPGSVCFNFAAGHPGSDFYTKSCGTGKYGWVREGKRAPFIWQTRIENTALSVNQYLICAPKNLTIQEVLISNELAVPAVAGTAWTFQLANLTSGLNMLAAAQSTANLAMYPHKEWSIIPTQNRTLMEDDVLELQITRVGAPPDLHQMVVTVVAIDCGMTEHVLSVPFRLDAALASPIAWGDLPVSQHILMSDQPMIIDRVTVVNDGAVGGGGDDLSLDVYNFGAAASMCSVLWDTNVIGPQNANEEWDLLVDQNNRIAAGNVIELQAVLVGGNPADLVNTQVNIYYRTFDEENFGGYRTAFCPIAQIVAGGVGAEVSEYKQLWVAPVDGTMVEGYFLLDTLVAFDPADYWVIYVRKHRKVPGYPAHAQDPHPQYLMSAPLTSITADLTADDNANDLTLDQNLTFKKGDVFECWIQEVATVAGPPPNLTRPSFVFRYQI